jgi:hypothetical protein
MVLCRQQQQQQRQQQQQQQQQQRQQAPELALGFVGEICLPAGNHMLYIKHYFYVRPNIVSSPCLARQF